MPDLDPLLPAEIALAVEPFDDDGLDAALVWDAQDGPDEDAPIATRWRPDDDAGAEWAMRKFAHYTADIAEIAMHADEYRRRIDEWERERVSPLARRASHMQGLLADYGYRVRTESKGKIKTIKLPAGEIRTRGNEDEGAVQYVDRHEFLTWAEAIDDPEIRMLMLRYEERPITEVREHLRVLKISAHWHVSFTDGHVINVAPDDLPEWLRRGSRPLEDGERVKCPVCGDPVVIVACEIYDDGFRIYLDRTDEEVPGVEYVMNDISITVVPHGR